MRILILPVCLLLLAFPTLAQETAVPDDLALITTENAAELEAVAIYGSGYFSAPAYSTDGTHVVTSGTLGTWWYEVDSPGAPRLLPEETMLGLTPGGLLATQRRRELTLWDITNAEPQRVEAFPQPRTIDRLYFRDDGAALALAVVGQRVHVWNPMPDINSGTQHRQRELLLSEWSGSVSRFEFDVNDDLTRLGVSLNYFACMAAPSGGLRLIDLTTRTVLAQDDDFGRFEGLRFSPDGNTLALLQFTDPTLRDETTPLPIRLFDARTGQEVPSFGGEVDGSEVLAFSPDGTQVLTFSARGGVRAWDTQTFDATILRPGTQPGGGGLASFSPSGAWLVTANLTGLGVSEVWRFEGDTAGSIASGEPFVVLPNAAGFGGIAFNADESKLVALARNGALTEVDLTTGEQTALWPGWGAEARLARTQSGAPLVFLSADGLRFHAWTDGDPRALDGTRLDALVPGAGPRLMLNIPTNEAGNTLRRAFDTAYRLVITPDGRLAATQDGSWDIRVWDVATAAVITTIDDSDSASLFDLAPDGTALFYRGLDGSVYRYDLAVGTAAPTVETEFTSAVDGLAFSPDGTRMVVSTFDQVGCASSFNPVYVYDLEADQLLSMQTFDAPGTPEGLTFNTDGSLVAFARARRIYLLDAVSGEIVFEEDGFSPLAFSEDGTLLGFRGEGGTFEVWGVG